MHLLKALCLSLLLPIVPHSISEGSMAFTLRSPAFPPGGEIPREFTCDGHDRSPPLEWSGAPAATRSYAFIMDDPDAPDPKAPKMTWVHWVLYDIPASVNALPPGADSSGLPPGTRAGLNSWKRTKYGGPCPPIGRHRYFHKLYALDAPLGDLGHPTVEQLTAAMKGHVLASAELIGTYERSGKEKR
jgi:Raf kinase inhibitor-like YbhB/YbcL family protein